MHRLFVAARPPEPIRRQLLGLMDGVGSQILARPLLVAGLTAFVFALMIGLTADDVNEWPSRIRAVDASQVRKAAQRLFRRNAVSAYLLPGAAK